MKPMVSETDAAVRTTQRSWMLLAGICLASTLGLVAAVLPLVEQRMDSSWPWAHTQRLLLLAFPLAVALAVAHIHRQQRRADAVRVELLAAREREAEHARRQSTRLSALLNVSRIMGSEVQLQNVFDAVTQICRDAFGCDQVSLMLVDKDAQELVVRSASGHVRADSMPGTRVKIGEGVAGHVAASGKPLVLGPGALDPGRFQNLRKPHQPLAAALVVPITVREELVGVLNVASHEDGTAYDEEDLQALKVFAVNVGSCIRHAEQAEWMRQLVQRSNAGAAPARVPVTTG